MKVLIAAVVTIAVVPVMFIVVIVAPLAASSTSTAITVAASCTLYNADLPAVLATIRTLESGGDYQAQSANSTASGAYQFIDSTWQTFATKADIDTSAYPHAKNASPTDQDLAAAIHVNEILDTHNAMIAAVPVVWYLGHLPTPGSASWDTIPAGNAITPRNYQTKWMGIYTDISTATFSAAAAFCNPRAGDPLNPIIDPTNQAWSMPIAPADLDVNQLDDPHHDYPALDYMTNPDTPIYAVTAGVVDRTTTWPHNWWNYGCGTSPTGSKPECTSCGIGVTIQSDNGLRHTYCHNNHIYVAEGDTVTAGQQIALSGDTGRSGAPHLHLEFRINNTRYCPQPVLQAIHNANPTAIRWITQDCTF